MLIWILVIIALLFLVAIGAAITMAIKHKDWGYLAFIIITSSILIICGVAHINGY